MVRLKTLALHLCGPGDRIGSLYARHVVQGDGLFPIQWATTGVLNSL